MKILRIEIGTVREVSSEERCISLRVGVPG